MKPATNNNVKGGGSKGSGNKIAPILSGSVTNDTNCQVATYQPVTIELPALVDQIMVRALLLNKVRALFLKEPSPSTCKILFCGRNLYLQEEVGRGLVHKKAFQGHSFYL